MITMSSYKHWTSILYIQRLIETIVFKSGVFIIFLKSITVSPVLGKYRTPAMMNYTIITLI